MASAEEIERRVDEFDAARSARRSATAQRIGELAQRRAAIAEQLVEIERELGDVLADATDAIDIDELTRFTDVPAADLTRWLTSRKTTRPKRKRPVDGGSAARSATSQGPPAARTPTPDTATQPAPGAPRHGVSTREATEVP